MTWTQGPNDPLGVLNAVLQEYRQSQGYLREPPPELLNIIELYHQAWNAEHSKATNTPTVPLISPPAPLNRNRCEFGGHNPICDATL